jgi:hypothetical protein
MQNLTCSNSVDPLSAMRCALEAHYNYRGYRRWAGSLALGSMHQGWLHEVLAIEAFVQLNGIEVNRP